MFATMRFKSIFGTKSLKLAIIFTFVHCFLSVTVLYVYTNWVLQNNEYVKSGLQDESSKNFIYIPKHVAENALINDVLRSDEFNIRGWWMTHEKWLENVECYNQDWGTCVKTFSVTCRVDSVKSIYQWLPLKKDVKVKGFDLSARVMAEDLQREAPDSLHGVQALVKLSDGSSEIVTLKFPEESHNLLYKRTNYMSRSDATIRSVTVMLCCYGFVGKVLFTDIVLTFKKDILPQSSLIAVCPEINFPKSEITSQVKLDIMNISRLSTNNYFHQVTLVTQLSMDRVGILEKSLATWEGPVSLAVFIPFDSTAEDSDWQKTYILKKLQQLSSKIELEVILVYSKTALLHYPINYLRNVAIQRAKTPYIFLVDADFYPAPDFQPKFDIVIRADRQIADETAWVVPAFEYLDSPSAEDLSPKTKEDLVEQVLAENSNIQPFRIVESPDSHRLTDYWQWYRAEYPYQISKYNDKYEPYIILKKSSRMPLYSELFTGYGMNKVSHITELFAKKYLFKVLHDLWVIHVPHRTTKYTMSFLQNPDKRLENRAVRFEFVADLMRRYKIGQCKDA